MDYSDYQTRKKEQILEVLKNLDLSKPDWSKPFVDTDDSTKYSVIIWYLKELVEKKEYLDQIYAVSEIYASDPDPTLEEDDLNKKILAGEEVRNIYTVRGTVSWLLTAISATFRTEYYTGIISMLEKLAVDPVYYVRIQATYPLSFFAGNIRARQHADGTPFNFLESDRQRVIDISFRMLREHRDLPRVLEGVTNIFEALRSVNESQAKEVIECLFYNSEGEIQPEYITRQSVPLLIFFAEFRSSIGDGFDGKWFQDFALKLLALPEQDAPYLRSTFIWHTWNVIKTNAEDYPKVKKYIPLFFGRRFEIQPLGQYDFLVQEVIKASPADGIHLFNTLLDYVLTWAPEYNIQHHAWLLTTHDIVQEIAKISPVDLLGILRKITDIVARDIYVGYLDVIYKSYLLVPDKEEGLAMRPEVLKLYEKVKQSRWADKIPETV
jgi:hypothetical protein